MEQIFSISYSNTVSGCILRAVYNTHVHGKYCNILLDDSSLTSCLIVTIKGTGTILLKDKTQIQLPEKTYYIGTHSDIHGLSSSCDHWHYSCFWFNPVGLNYADHLLLTNRDCDPEEEDRFATELISLIQSGDSNNIKLANALFTSKFLSLRPYKTDSLSSSVKLFQEVISYINKNLNSITSIKDIAGHFAYSEKHLRSIFKTHAKMSPKKYIQKLKLEQICTLLKTSSISLQEMVELFNFASISHLISSFKNEYGVTPTVYKNLPRSQIKEFEKKNLSYPQDE